MTAGDVDDHREVASLLIFLRFPSRKREDTFGGTSGPEETKYLRPKYFRSGD
jgi:hypothetical protein